MRGEKIFIRWMKMYLKMGKLGKESGLLLAFSGKILFSCPYGNSWYIESLGSAIYEKQF